MIQKKCHKSAHQKKKEFPNVCIFYKKKSTILRSINYFKCFLWINNEKNNDDDDDNCQMYDFYHFMKEKKKKIDDERFF